jgi:hypothetical protein
VVGCLQEEPAGAWKVKSASDAERTRNPRESTPEEEAGSKAKAAGTGVYRLLDTLNFPSQTVSGKWVEAKGFLIRSPGDDKINLTWLRVIGDACK